MKFSAAIDAYLTDMKAYGRINTARTEIGYRSRLNAHADDVNNRDPRKTGRDDVKRTLRRWTHPNTQRTAHAVLVSFYDWAMEEGLRETNPARQVRRAKARDPETYRMSLAEVIAVLDVARHDQRDRWIAGIGLYAGARNQEMRGLQGRHFRRPGFVWFSSDIAKGGRERWVPVVPEFEPVFNEIATVLDDDHHLAPARRPRDGFAPADKREWNTLAKQPASPQAVWRQVVKLGERAGIAARITPHSLRHAFGDHLAKYGGLRAAQEMLGHADVSTTEGYYVSRPSLDELAASVSGFGYRRLSAVTHPVSPDSSRRGIEPVHRASSTGKPDPTRRDG